LKKIIIFLLLHFVVNSPVIVCAKQLVTIYGDNNYPPYSFQENDQPIGIYFDVLKLVFSKMPDYEVKVKMIPWKLGTSCLKRGECMALFPPYYVKDRLPWMQLSEPILKEDIVVFGKAEKLKGKASWPQDFMGFQFGLNRGFNTYGLGGDAFGDACKAGKIIIQEAKNNDHNLKKLEKGRIDFYLNDRLIDISKYPSIKRGIVVSSNYGHLGFTKKEENFKYLTDFKKKFNIIIKQIKASNQIEKIVQSYIK